MPTSFRLEQDRAGEDEVGADEQNRKKHLLVFSAEELLKQLNALYSKENDYCRGVGVSKPLYLHQVLDKDQQKNHQPDYR